MNSRYLALIPLTLIFLLSLPRSVNQGRINQLKNKYKIIASGFWDSEKKNLECVNYGDKSTSGRIIFQDKNSKNISYRPFNINSKGLAKINLNLNKTANSYGNFILEVSKDTLNCFITSDSNLFPFDQKLNGKSYISLEQSKTESTKLNLISFANQANNQSEFNIKQYAHDGNLVKTEKITLKAGQRIIQEKDIKEIGLIEITPVQIEQNYSASLLSQTNATNLAKNGNCNERSIKAFKEKNKFLFTNVEDTAQRVFLSIYNKDEQLISNDSVLIPAKASYSLSHHGVGKINVSCNIENKIIIKDQNKKPSIITKTSKNKVLLPISRASTNKNLLTLYSKNSDVDISIYTTSGKKIHTAFNNLKIQGRLTIPIDQEISRNDTAVLEVSAKNLEIQLERENELKNSISFPIFELSSLAQANQLSTPQFETLKLNKRCVTRNKSAIPNAEITYDFLKFKINKDKLISSGVEKIDTYKILNQTRVQNISRKNNFFLEEIFDKKYLEDKDLFYNNLCSSLLYARVEQTKQVRKHLEHVQNLSFDYKNNQSISLPGSAWLKSNPDKYLFCVKTLPDCDSDKKSTVEFAKAFISPTKAEVKPSQFFPLLTIERPYIPIKSKKAFKIKAFIHDKVPYEVIASVQGIKQKKNDINFNCKDLNTEYYLQFNNNRWTNSRKNWAEVNKLDLSLSTNSVTFLHSDSSNSTAKISHNCQKYYENCELGTWSLNVSNGYNSGSEPLGWGKFSLEDKSLYRWNALPLLSIDKIEFTNFENSKLDYSDCDLSSAKVIVRKSKNFKTLPERIAIRESKNKYAFPRKIYHPNTYPINQPAPGIPYSVKSWLNPYRTKNDRSTLIESVYMEGEKWLDTLPQ